MALAPIKTFASIVQRGLDPSALVRLAAREIAEGGRSLATVVLAKRFPELTGRQRFSVVNVANRSVKVGNQLERGGVVTVGQVPVDPTLFGDEPMGFRSEVVVRITAPTFPDETGRVRTSIRQFNLAFEDIPSIDEVRAAAIGELVASQSGPVPDSDPVDIGSIDPLDIDIISFVRRF